MPLPRCIILKKKQVGGRNGIKNLVLCVKLLCMPVKFQVSNWFRKEKTNIWVLLTISSIKWYLKTWDWKNS